MRTSIRSVVFVLALGAFVTVPAVADAQSRVPTQGAVRGPAPATPRGQAVARPPAPAGRYYAPAGRYYGPAGRYYPGGHYYPAGGYYYPYYRSAFYVSASFGSPYWYGAPWFGFGVGWGYPYYGWGGCCGWGAWGGWGYPYGPYGYSGPYGPYGYYGWYDGSADVRIDAQPVNAEVFVDGYRAGVVDDFDGVFQRLRVNPGEHEITLYLPGYRTVRAPMYLGTRSSKTMRLELERLGPGETADPPPAPVERSSQSAPSDEPQRRSRPEPREPAPPRVEVAPVTRFGTLSLQVQPADAEIRIDGERWSTTPGEGRIMIRLSPGRHLIEIRKEGFERYGEEIGIREDATFTLNVSLKRN